MEVQEIRISELTPYFNNPRKNDDAVVKVAESIQAFGFQNPIIADVNKVIIAGHTRWKAALKLNFKTVPVIITDLPEEKAKAYRIADNRMGEFAEWDWSALEIEMEDFDEELKALLDFEIPDVTNIGSGLIDDDYVPEVEDVITKPGDLWKLGEHRLLCGDATNVDDVERLMGGKKADMVFTDPPYNIASDSENFASDVSKAMHELANSEWDKNFEIERFLVIMPLFLKDDCSIYIFTSHFLFGRIFEFLKENFDFNSYCIWSKPNPMPSLSKRHWTWNTELCAYATKGKHIFNFPQEGHLLSTWVINKKSDGSHPTQKPIELCKIPIKASSRKNGLIIDLFLGSGSTLIACEETNRKCYGMEIDPHYCDVIIKRWEEYTGQTAELVNGH